MQFLLLNFGLPRWSWEIKLLEIMKNKILKGILVGLTFGIIVYSSEKSFASEGNKLIDKLDCKNSNGTIVSNGAACVGGDSNCIPNACPPGSNIE